MNSSVDIFVFSVRSGKTLRTFDFTLPNFHFILPKFYFSSPWRISVSHEAIWDFLGYRPVQLLADGL